MQSEDRESHLDAVGKAGEQTARNHALARFREADDHEGRSLLAERDELAAQVARQRASFEYADTRVDQLNREIEKNVAQLAHLPTGHNKIVDQTCERLNLLECELRHMPARKHLIAVEVAEGEARLRTIDARLKELGHEPEPKLEAAQGPTPDAAPTGLTEIAADVLRRQKRRGGP